MYRSIIYTFSKFAILFLDLSQNIRKSKSHFNRMLSYRATNARHVALPCTSNVSHIQVVVCLHRRHRLRHRHYLANVRSPRNYGSSGRWAEMQLPINWNPATMAPTCCAFVLLDNHVSNMKLIMPLVSSKLKRLKISLF